MKNYNFVLSLITKDNDFQQEQATAAEEAARRLGVGVQTIWAEGDSVQQSQQILKYVQCSRESQPAGILVEPVGGTALPQVARAAVATGIAWVVLNREVEYVTDLRRTFHVPVFQVTSDNDEIGRIQGRQFAALLPKGGTVLYLQGPSESYAAKQRTIGMYETKPENVAVKTMRGNWTETSTYKAVHSWLRLSTSQHMEIGLVAAQNDVMAMGARRAFQELPESEARDRWLSLPFIGCDGVPKTGQNWVRNGSLTATVVAPALTGHALEILVRALQSGTVPPERTLLPPRPFPALESLGTRGSEKAHAASPRL
jgi:ribose transport system substrate-binding protein